MCVRKCSCRHVSMHESDYDCNNGRFVTKGDYVDDGNDECFTVMVMIITIVVLVSRLRCAECAAHQLTVSTEFLLHFHLRHWSRCFQPEPFTAGRFRSTYARGTAVDGSSDAFLRTLLRLVFDNVKLVAFPQMSCTLLCPLPTAVSCLLCYYPCIDTLYSPLRVDFRSSLTTISYW